jgi:hypothetical protein
MAHGSEHISAMCCSTFNAVPMVDSSFSCFTVDIEMGEVVVKVDRPGAKIASKQSSMSGEDCCHIDTTLSAKRNGEPRKPLVEVDDNGLLRLAKGELDRKTLVSEWIQNVEGHRRTSPRNQATR